MRHGVHQNSLATLFFQRNRENVPDFFLLELLGLIFFFIGTDGGEAWICYGKTESFLV